MSPLRHLRVFPRMHIATLALALGACTSASSASAAVPPSGVAPVQEQGPSTTRNAAPRLVVMLVVDQLRAPFLDRYAHRFTGGLRRLLDDGRVFTRASHDHAVTETAPGHASLATGVYPMRHGIVANEWSEQSAGRWVTVTNVGDSTERIVGAPTLPGASPRRQRVRGLADWMVAADARSIVASVSAKDRGAIRPAGLTRGHVYWFDARVGRFVTSTYYRDRYPDWAERFTREVLPRYARDSIWSSSIPPTAGEAAPPDSVAWEFDGVHTSFPHRVADEAKPGQFWNWFIETPFIDAATVDYAQTMIEALDLGGDASPDFLNVSLSATDYIGHRYGPLSREQLDNLLRLDRQLGRLFATLDARVGKGRWVVGLSADHGALLSPETLPQPGESTAGRRATAAEYAAIRAVLDSARALEADATAPARVATLVRRLPFVARAVTHAELAGASPADSFDLLARRSHFPGRATGPFGRFGVSTRFVEGWLPMTRGSTHGTPYWFDRHVPIILMGAGIDPGRDSTRAATVDFAPTLARLVGLPVPEKLDGRVLPTAPRKSRDKKIGRPVRTTELPLLGSNQDSSDPESDVLPVTPRGIGPSGLPEA